MKQNQTMEQNNQETFLKIHTLKEALQISVKSTYYPASIYVNGQYTVPPAVTTEQSIWSTNEQEEIKAKIKQLIQTI